MFVSGFLGGFVEGALFATPQKNLQSKIMAGLYQPNPQEPKFLFARDAVKQVFAQEGLKGAYRRYPAIALREGFYNGALFFTFAQLHKILQV